MRKNVKTITLILILIGAVGLAYLSYTNYNDVKTGIVDEVLNKEIPTDKNVVEDGVTAKNDIKPDGYGIKRELTGALKENTVKGIGDIDFSDVEAESFQIIGKLAEDKDMIESYIKKEQKEYTSIIDWTYGNITPDEYTALVVLCGQMYEDEINKSESNRYTVEAKIPGSEELNTIGVKLLFDTDEDNMLTLWTDLIIRDSLDNMEIQELKSFTLYYEGTKVKIK